MTLRSRDFLALGRLAALASHEKKALDIRLFDARQISGVAEYFLLASVDSQPQMEAVLDFVSRAVRERYDVHPLRRDGIGSRQWTVLDYGGLVVHLMHRTAREFYRLERLWDGARAVPWEEKARARRKPKADVPKRRKR